MPNVKSSLAFASLLVLGLGGCASIGSMTSAEGLRSEGKVNAFTVQRPFFEVAQILTDNSRQCLSGTASTFVYRFGQRVTNWRPQITAGEGTAEMILRADRDSPFEPDGGVYVAAVDLTDNRDGTTGVRISLVSSGTGEIGPELEGWMRGTSDLCPDLTDTSF